MTTRKPIMMLHVYTQILETENVYKQYNYNFHVTNTLKKKKINPLNIDFLVGRQQIRSNIIGFKSYQKKNLRGCTSVSWLFSLSITPLRILANKI